MLEKPCSRCGNVLPPSAFSPDRRAKTGLQPACRECNNARKVAKRIESPEKYRAIERQRYAQNPDVRLTNNAKWRERNRDTLLASKNAYHERMKGDPIYRLKRAEYAAANKVAKQAYDRIYQVVNRQKLVERAKEWAKANPDKRRAITANYDGKRRAWKASGVTGRDLRAWIAQQAKACHWCASDCDDDFHVDHVIPLSKGGDHELHNLVIACPPCNLRKSAKMPDEFRAQIAA